MKTRRHPPLSSRAFTLVEMLIGAALASGAGLAIFAVVHAAMLLAARNLSVNLTSTSQRGALDRAEQILQQADTLPVLIGTSGTASTAPAAGVSFDSYLGGPYVISAPPTGLPANTTVLTVIRSTNPFASPPLPRVGDILRISNTDPALRPRVAAVFANPPDAAQHQAVSVTLAAALGTPVTFVASTVLTGKFVRPAALLTMPVGGKRELRYYPLLESTTNLSAPANYVLLTDQVGMQPGDATPFSLTTTQGRTFVSLSLRVRASNFDQRLAGRQADQFNTFSRVDTVLARKLSP